MLALGNLDFWAAWMLIVACCMLVDQVHMDAPFPSVILGSPFLEIGTQLQGLSCLNLSVHERSKATCVRLPFLQQTTESGFKNSPEPLSTGGAEAITTNYPRFLKLATEVMVADRFEPR
jgi:hypothetical protein